MSEYSLTEIFVIKFVLADIVIIATLLFAGPLYAVVIVCLLIVSTFLMWFAADRLRSRAVESNAGRDPSADQEDPVTTLQNRYAAGDLSEAEFERAIEQLIDANERAAAAGVETSELELEGSSR